MDLALQLSGVFRTKSRSEAKKRFRNLETQANAHPDLHAAIEALKKYEPELVRFHDFVTSKDDWLHLKGIRCVSEYQMRNIKRLYRAKFGFRTKKTPRPTCRWL